MCRNVPLRISISLIFLLKPSKNYIFKPVKRMYHQESNKTNLYSIIVTGNCHEPPFLQAILKLPVFLLHSLMTIAFAQGMCIAFHQNNPYCYH